LQDFLKQAQRINNDIRLDLSRQPERADSRPRKQRRNECACIAQRVEQQRVVRPELEEQASDLCFVIKSYTPPPGLSTRKALLAGGSQGDASRKAMQYELDHLMTTKRAVVPVHNHDLTHSKRSKILSSIGLLKNKFDPNGDFVKTKGRIVNDGRRMLLEEYSLGTFVPSTSTSID